MSAYVITMQHHSSGNIVICDKNGVLTNGFSVKTVPFVDSPTAGTGFSRNRGLISATNTATVVSDTTNEIARTRVGDATTWDVFPTDFNLVPTIVTTGINMDEVSAHKWLFNDARRLLVLQYFGNEMRRSGIWLETGNGTNVFYDSLDRMVSTTHPTIQDTTLNIKYAYINPNKQFVVGTTTHEYVSSDTTGVTDWTIGSTNVPYTYGHNSPSGGILKWTDTTIEINGMMYSIVNLGVAGNITAATIHSTNSNEIVVITDLREIAFSSDGGLNWVVNNISNRFLRITRLCHGNGRYVALGTTGGTNIEHSLVSTDGVNWTLTFDVFNSVSFLDAAGNNTRTLAFGNGIFVTVGYTDINGGRIFTSVDGITWVERFMGHLSSSNYAEFNFRRVVFGNGVFVVISQYGTMAISKNGIQWQLLHVDDLVNKPAGIFTEITFIPTLGFFVGSIDSRIHFSYDGIVWHSFQSSDVSTSSVSGGLLSYNPIDIHFFGGNISLIVAASAINECSIVTAVTGIGWTRHSIPVTAYAAPEHGKGDLVGQYAFLEGAPMLNVPVY